MLKGRKLNIDKPHIIQYNTSFVVIRNVKVIEASEVDKILFMPDKVIIITDSNLMQGSIWHIILKRKGG